MTCYGSKHLLNLFSLKLIILSEHSNSDMLYSYTMARNRLKEFTNLFFFFAIVIDLPLVCVVFRFKILLTPIKEGNYKRNEWQNKGSIDQLNRTTSN